MVTKRGSIEYPNGSTEKVKVHSQQKLDDNTASNLTQQYLQTGKQNPQAFVELPSESVKRHEQSRAIDKQINAILMQVEEKFNKHVKDTLNEVVEDISESIASNNTTELRKSLIASRDAALEFEPTDDVLYLLAQDKPFLTRLLRENKIDKSDVQSLAEGKLSSLRGIWKKYATNADIARISGQQLAQKLQLWQQVVTQLGQLAVQQTMLDNPKFTQSQSAIQNIMQTVQSVVQTAGQNVQQAQAKTLDEFKRSGLVRRDLTRVHKTSSSAINKEALRSLLR